MKQHARDFLLFPIKQIYNHMLQKQPWSSTLLHPVSRRLSLPWGNTPPYQHSSCGLNAVVVVVNKYGRHDNGLHLFSNFSFIYPVKVEFVHDMEILKQNKPNFRCENALLYSNLDFIIRSMFSMSHNVTFITRQNPLERCIQCNGYNQTCMQANFILL